MSLFNTLDKPDRQKTQLAYRVKYWPWAELTQNARELIAWKQHRYMTICELLRGCNEELTHYMAPRLATLYNSMGLQQHTN